MSHHRGIQGCNILFVCKSDGKSASRFCGPGKVSGHQSRSFVPCEVTHEFGQAVDFLVGRISKLLCIVPRIIYIAGVVWVTMIHMSASTDSVPHKPTTEYLQTPFTCLEVNTPGGQRTRIPLFLVIPIVPRTDHVCTERLCGTTTLRRAPTSRSRPDVLYRRTILVTSRGTREPLILLS